MSAPVDISVVMVGMNTRDYVRSALSSLMGAKWGRFTFEVIYVDNNSRDDTVAMIAREFPDVVVIANKDNRHFCPAANQGSQSAKGRFLLHLNNDTLVDPEAIAQMAEYLDKNPNCSVAGCRLLNPDGTDQWSARRFPSWYNSLLGRRSMLSKVVPKSRFVRDYLFKDQIVGAEPFCVDWTGTPCLLVRKESFFSVGGFPEDFYYWHEAVFCNRLVRKRGETWIVPTARVVHFEGKGGGPRPYAIRRWHIKDFGKGAYRFYCERHSLHQLNPLRWLAAGGLGVYVNLSLFALWVGNLKGNRA